MSHQHQYQVVVEWAGNRGEGTAQYDAYARDYIISAAAKPPIAGSSDAAFRGDPARWNPEDLLVAAISACHKLWYLHLCAEAGVSVQAYRDQATGTMIEDAKSGGRFTEVLLRPHVVIRPGDDLVTARRLHHEAHALCFIANSVNFPVACLPTISVESGHADA